MDTNNLVSELNKDVLQEQCEQLQFSQQTEEKYNLITRNLQEVLGKTELKKILEVRDVNVYWGTAPTKLIHIGYLFQALKIKDLVNAGCNVTILIADLHAVLDNLKSTMETVAFRAEYYKKIMIAILGRLGVNLNKVKFVLGSSFQTSPEYTLDMYRMTSITNVTQCQHAGAEVVKQTKSPEMSNLLYPILQALDMPYLKQDMFLGGIDQRKINTFALEYLPKIGYTQKYIYLMTPMMSGLSTKKSSNIGKSMSIEEDIANKMSSSTDSSKIDLLASPEKIKNIISKAYCADGDVEDNSVLKIIKNIVFNITNEFEIPKWDNESKSLITGKVYTNFDELKTDVSLGSSNGGIHPADLKQGLANFLIEFLKPIRDYFDTEENKQLLINAYG